MTKYTNLLLLLGALACASASASMPFAEPDAWHEIVIEGKPHMIAEYDGMAIIEGDIVLGKIDDVLNNPSRAVFNRRLWPDGIVGYTIAATMPGTNVNRIMGAIAHIEAVTDIVFEPRDTGDYVLFNPSSSTCSSYIGRQGGQQGIALAPNCSQGNTVHEIMHALGFFHEHQRPDRNDYITVDTSQACFGSSSQFTLLSTFESDQMGPYDYGSMMHYFWNAFSCTGQPTIIGPPGVPLGSLLNMSPLDIQAVQYLYFVPDYSTDADGDDIENVDDLCLGLVDAVQVDSDADGFGNLCDPDLNNDGVINAIDLGILRLRFFSADPDADFNSDGSVNALDLGVLKTFFFLEPGPSGRTPGKPQIAGTPVATNQGDGTITIDLSWTVAAGLPDEYIVEADTGSGFAEVCRTADESCSAAGISDSFTSATLRVRAVAPYGNEGANSSAVTVTF